MNWADLFERAESHDADVETIRDRLAALRAESDDSEGRDDA